MVESTIKNNLVFLLVNSPLNKFSNHIYQFIYSMNKPLLFLIGDKCWVRNSVAFRYTSLALSDFDLALYLDKKPTSEKMDDIKLMLKVLKYTLGRLGETVIYCGEDLDFFISFANPLELARDPFFKGKWEASASQKACFLSRMYLSDREKIKYLADHRLKKWKFIFSLLRDPTSELSPKNLDETIIKMIEKYHQSGLVEHERIWSEPSYIEILDNDLLEEQIKWEIWGLYTQLYFKDETYPSHLELLVDITVRHLQGRKNYGKILKGLELLKRSL